MVVIEVEYEFVPSISSFVWARRGGLVWPKLKFNNKDLWAMYLLSEYIAPYRLSNDLFKEIGIDFYEITSRAVKRFNCLRESFFQPESLIVFDPDVLSAFLIDVCESHRNEIMIYRDYFLVILEPLLRVMVDMIHRFMVMYDIDVVFDEEKVILYIPKHASRILSPEKTIVSREPSMSFETFIGYRDIRLMGKEKLQRFVISIYWSTPHSNLQLIDEGELIKAIYNFDLILPTLHLYVIRKNSISLPSAYAISLIGEAKEIKEVSIDEKKMTIDIPYRLSDLLESGFEQLSSTSSENTTLTKEELYAIWDLILKIDEGGYIRGKSPTYLSPWLENLMYRLSKDLLRDIFLTSVSAMDVIINM